MLTCLLLYVHNNLNLKLKFVILPKALVYQLICKAKISQTTGLNISACYFDKNSSKFLIFTQFAHEEKAFCSKCCILITKIIQNILIKSVNERKN